MCSYLARTDPRDVARLESKTVIITEKKEDTIPTPKEGVEGRLGQWMSPAQLEEEMSCRLPGCMKGQFWPLGDVISELNSLVRQAHRS